MINFQQLYWACTFQLKKQIEFQNQEFEIKASNLFDEKYYLERNAEDIKGDISAILHFLMKGAKENRDPHPLFSISYYLEQNPDVVKSKINPFLHFIRFGWQEGRSPSPLFDINYYRHHYAKNLHEGENPLLHYVRNSRQFNPNSYFDTKSYLQKYSDVANLDVNPLRHYLFYGAKEGRATSCNFDAKFYEAKYPEFKDTGLDALSHFLRYGLAEGRLGAGHNVYAVVQDRDIWQRLLPSGDTIAKQNISQNKTNSPVSIIMPIYRDTAMTKACIESILNSKNQTKFKLILLNDCSPEPEMKGMLSLYETNDKVEVFHNVSNLGFVGTVNKGMSLYPESDVLLLNSDTLVANNWLDKICAQAYSSDRIATVTPYSNNATICNFPNLRGFAEFPQGENVFSYDSAFAFANLGKNIEIPTAVGFCMFIKRKALEEIGLFDVETFGKGYGEENDFCLKALAKDWKHILAADTFVYHAGEVSFAANSSVGKKNATKVLLERYPYYNNLVAQHIEKNEISHLTLAAISALYSQNNKPTELLISHALGGGVETHLRNILEEEKEEKNFIILRPPLMNKKEHDFKLEFPHLNIAIQFVVDSINAVDFAAHYLATFSLSNIQIHHTLQVQFPILEFIRKLNKPFDFTVHDYLTICPQITLTNLKGEYCEEPNEEGCNNCIRSCNNEIVKGMTIREWRDSQGAYLENANTLFCPSQDVIKRMKRYHPTLNYQLAPHDKFYNFSQYSSTRECQNGVVYPEISESSEMKILIMGALWPHKGSNFVLDVARNIEPGFNLNLMGYFRADQNEVAKKYINITGPYQKNQIEVIVNQINPHLIWLPSRCPETYSFTLSEAIKLNLPILAPNIGAYQERLENRPYSWIYDWKIEPAQFLKLLQKIRSELADVKTSLRVNSR
ncbi:MAG: glycosyltransferase [Proteobacteria bacterium]|nr:glycosyltransferase [Pseudomonadota bacterium]